ncbi:hypothetical protein MKX03_028190 [Papaver bracteatum]|nr:hypothetical protein MKX03_028190 [Papaver bracteatum]
MHMMGIERILSSEHDHQKQENATTDSFVVDIDNLSQVTLHDHHHDQHHRDINTTPNSNTNFQRSLSRKVSSQRGVGNGGGAENESSSNKEIGFVNGDLCVSANKLMSTLVDLPQVVTASNVSSSVETTQNMININVNQKGQQMVTVAAAESNNNSKLMKKRSHSKHHNQMKSSSQPRNWMMDPRRILFFFASLSSMGTIILIYFTLSIGKFSGDVSDA